MGELSKPGPLEPRVHGARRDLRKARAALKLLRPAIGKSSYKKENALCREAGRLLSPARDAQALAAAWRGLHVRAPRISRALADEAREASESLDSVKSLTFLSMARSRAKKIAPSKSGWGGLKAGLRRSYADARRAWKRARRSGDDRDFHEWRKRVKDERYQLELLAGGSGALERLSDLLGDDHDLVVLRGKLGPGDAAALRAIGSKQARLRRKALALAEMVYAQSAAAYERRVRRAWKRARDLK